MAENLQLYEGERLDDLQVNGLKIIQNASCFRFSCDAVELADFVSGSAKDYACDLGSGSGIIAILLAGKRVYASPRLSCSLIWQIWRGAA